MPTLFKPGSQEETDDRLNPSNQDYERRVSAYANSGIKELEDMNRDAAESDNKLNTGDEKSDGNTSKDLQDGETKPWTMGNMDAPKNEKASFLVKLAKKKGIIGIVGTLGVTGGLFAGFLGPGSMIISLMENITTGNDSSSTAMERRFMKAFTNMSIGDPICSSTTKSIRCKMGRISNSALRKLDRKGVTAYFDDVGKDKFTGKRTGYPSSNPKVYAIADGDTIRNIRAEHLKGFLSQPENRKLASKILGTRGAFNLRVKAWTGKHIANKLYKKAAINRSGGTANGEHTNTKGKSRYAATMEKMRAKIPGLNRILGVKEGLKAKTQARIKKAGRAGAGYTIAVAGCVAAKLPGYVAGGVAAYQLAQILPFAMDFVLSPGSKAKAAGGGSGFSADDMEAAGTALTQQTPRESDGKLTSALDSKYLLAAAGVEKSRQPISKFTPGYGILASGFFTKAKTVEKKTRDSCNVIMSPAAMYSAMAVDATATVAASATIIGGIIKIGVSVAVVVVAQEVLSNIAADVGDDVIRDLADSDIVEKAEGEELGDVIGLSSAAFFSAGGMARNLPTLTTDQAVAFNDMREENEQFQKEMDIASLSPFDASSKYTFLGSIVNGLRLSMLSTGSYNNSVSSLLTNIFSLSTMSFANPVSAGTNFSESYCGYAEDFDMTTDSINDGSNPAINMAGLPCVGITTEQDTMSTGEAIDLMASQGWIDESAESNIADDATIDDLIAGGYIRSDTPLTNYIESCSDATTGDYLYGSAGCVMDSSTPDKNVTSIEACGEDTNSEGATVKSCASGVVIDDSTGAGEASNISVASTPSQRALIAIPVFLLDYQIIQSVNGEDEETYESETQTSVIGDASPLPVGSSQELAEIIKNDSSIGDKTGQINALAGGQRNDVSNKLLSVIAALGTKNEFTISSMKRASALSVGAGSKSLHLTGEAVDLSGSSGVNGVKIPNYSDVNDTIKTFLIEVANTIQSEKCEIGVPNSTYVTLVKGTSTSCYVFVDVGSGPHIHIGVR